MNAFVGVLVFVLPALAYVLTVLAVVRTREWAKSPQSQTAWLFLAILMPALGTIFFWLTEMPQRRNRSRQPPAALA